MRFLPAGLKPRLLALLLAALLPWCLVLAVQIYGEWREAKTLALEETSALARLVAYEQREVVQSTRQLLATLATAPELREEAPGRCTARLKSVLAVTEGYANFGVIGLDGRLRCAARGEPGLFLGDRDYFQTALHTGRFAVGSYIVGRLTGRPVLPMAQLLRGGTGQITGVVFAALDLDWLNDTLAAAARRADLAVSLVDRNAVVLARVPEDRAQIGRRHRVPWLVAAIRAGRAAGAGESVTETGESRFLSFVRVGGPDAPEIWAVVSVGREAVLAPVRGRLLERALFLGLATALALAVAMVLAERWILSGVRALCDTAQALSRGNFDVRARLASEGEVGELAQSFDAMAQALQRSFGQTEAVMDVVPEAIVVCDRAGRIEKTNARLEQLCGVRTQEVLGQPFTVLLPEKERARYARLIEGALNESTTVLLGAPGLEVPIARRPDGVFPAEVTIAPLATLAGQWVVVALRDVSERKRYEEEIRHQATHDALTGLPNRLLFRELLAEALHAADRNERLVAVLFLDLDGFKTVNDSLGHAVGDAVLIEVGRRLTQVLRQEDVVARQGGDEFTIFLPNVTVVADITQVANKILAVLAQPYTMADRTLHLTASLGITIYPFDDTDVDNLLRNADTAMYAAKSAGRNTYRFYTADMNAAVAARLALEEGLREALAAGNFELWYQPQVALAEGRLVGAEALLRWRHPSRGLVLPGEFIGVAEDSGLIEPIGEWVIAEACRMLARLASEGAGLSLAVNLSPRQLRRADFAERLAAILEATGTRALAGRLELEITESMLMNDVEASIAHFERLRALGLELAIDDFGTGYSSLAYLKRLPITTLKIDRSFVDGVTGEGDDAAIARAIIQLGQVLRLSVIAEGVETEEQRQWLRRAGCTLGQGWLFGRPMPAEEFLARVRAEEAASKAV